MLGPGDFLRLPADTADAVRRVVRELVVVRVLLERAVTNLEDEFDHLNKEVAHLKRRVDEIADTVPTLNREVAHLDERVDEIADIVPSLSAPSEGGALAKVKDALTGNSDSQG